jgi:ABC-2 type transport system permease protein
MTTLDTRPPTSSATPPRTGGRPPGRTAALTRAELKLLLREPLTTIVGVLFPAVLMVLLVGAFGNEPDPAMGGVGGADFYVPVYAAATIAVLGFMSIPTHLASYRESGVLRRLRAAGVPATAIVVAQAATMALLVLVGVALMLAIGFAAYDLSTPVSAAGVATGFAAGTAAFAGIGVLLGSLMSTARAAQGVGLVLFFGLFFISGGGPPPDLMPGVLNDAVRFTPMGPLVSAIRDPWHGAGWNIAALGALATIAVVSTAIAIRRFSRR